MATFDPKTILAELEALRVKDKERRVFGANDHDYALAPKLSLREVEAVEEQFGVELPRDYRTFLLEIGAGGAGPAYGIFPLVKVGTWGWDGEGSNLTRELKTPFPHTKAWNLSYPEMSEDEDEDAYWERREKWDDEVYWNPKQTTGAICICHEGCAIRDWLVVTGEERGRIWLDDRASDGGLIPREMTFADWYLKWLSVTTQSLL